MLRPDSLLAGALAGGLVYGLAALTAGSPTAPGPGPDAARAATPEPAIDAATDSAEPLEAVRLAALEARLETLERRLAELGDARRPVVTPELETATLATLVPDTEEQRALVLEVLEDQRAREEQERQEAFRARELERSQERADRLAEALGLSGAERDTLAAIFAEESEERLGLVDRLREVDPEDRPARDELRDDLRGLRDRTSDTIDQRLGLGTAERIDTWESENRQRRFGGGLPFGGFGGRGGD